MLFFVAANHSEVFVLNNMNLMAQLGCKTTEEKENADAHKSLFHFLVSHKESYSYCHRHEGAAAVLEAHSSWNSVLLLFLY